MWMFGCWTISSFISSTGQRLNLGGWSNRCLQKAQISNRLDASIPDDLSETEFSIFSNTSTTPFCPIVDNAVSARCCWFGFHRRQCQTRLLPGDSLQRRGMGL